MTYVTKSARIAIKFDTNEISTMGISKSRNDAALSINTKDDTTVEIKFDTVQDAKTFIDKVVTLAMRMNWDEDYNSAYLYTGDVLTTVDNLKTLLDQPVEIEE